MFLARPSGLLLAIMVAGLAPAVAQEPAASGTSRETIAQLVDQLRAQDARLKELEAKVAQLKLAQPNKPAGAEAPIPAAVPAPAEGSSAPILQSDTSSETHEHTMTLPGSGPALKFRAFGDFNWGFGPDANSLIFPLPPPVHNTFQIGELDLFFSSKLSSQVSALAEMVVGSDPANDWGLDIERLQVTYKANPYFEISGGRYHIAIGYYNTAFHHGTWFQTATGRPFMDFFEDSGGILPIHGVGVTATGLLPRTGGLDLHWVAEVSNGRTSDASRAPVQNFLADKNHKAFNVAAYIKPQWISGLQVGGSFYRDRLVPPGIPHVNQNIASLYAVYNNSAWELLNEAVLINNKMDGSTKSFNSPLAYAQISRKFGIYRPYFRFQYVNVPADDPVNAFRNRYDGPSFGLRMDFTEYAALKAQYNRLYQRGPAPRNGLDLQVAFTF